MFERIRKTLTRQSRRRDGRGERAGDSRQSAHPYAAVAIKPVAGRACREAVRIAGIRFLCREAPLLPLRNCNASVCECRYVHFNDRRQSRRRDADIGIAARMTVTEDRRTPCPGRRAGDLQR